MTRPLASLSLDLDNAWSYLKTHADPGWEAFPSYLDVLVPRALDALRAHRLRITFMVVGQDAALAKNHEPLCALADAGHEIGNHSFHHEPWLNQRSDAEIEDELTRAEDAIEAATGVRPRGFRGPGYAISASILEILARRGYAYDASTFPTFLGPLARAYYFRGMRGRLDADELAARAELFGTLADGLRPIVPYRWATAHGGIVEIPVTTMPGLRAPFHVSYLLYLRVRSRRLALAYLDAALALCRATGTPPSILLHPLDLLGADDAPGLAFFPGMGLPVADKLELLDAVLRRLTAAFDVVALDRHAATIARQPRLVARDPRRELARVTP